MRTGGCQCGRLRCESAGEPLALHVCHCRECQKQSASAFGMSLTVPRSSFSLTAGEPNVWSRPTDNGGRSEAAFCPACGSRVWRQASATSETLNVKAGSLDKLIDLASAVHIWVSRKLRGVVIPEGLEQHPREPPAG